MSSCSSNPSSNKCCGGACLTKNSKSILTWSNPKASAIAAGSILSSLLLVKYVNLLSLFFRISTFALLGAGVAEYSGKIVTGKGFITRFKPKTYTCLGQAAEYYAPHAVTILKKVELQAQALYTAANVECTVRAGIASFFLFKLTSFFSLWTIAFVGTILAFTVPPVYLANKECIDKTVAESVKTARAKADEGIKIVNDKYGPQIEKAKSAAAPLFKLIESKLPVRTAGTTVDEPLSSSSTTTSAAVVDHDASASIKKVNAHSTPAEVDFNALGEQLKNEATAATADAEAFTREKVNPPAQF